MLPTSSDLDSLIDYINFILLKFSKDSNSLNKYFHVKKDEETSKVFIKISRTKIYQQIESGMKIEESIISLLKRYYQGCFPFKQFCNNPENNSYIFVKLFKN